ncbi:hypothetical protein FLACOL_01494 [Flavobacterium columnare]|uniref:Secretion system C-terminal sorting domain-containing protein n=2 Tax=Flavobacterium TaxID=237 RepID=A0A2N9PAX8_9FLAO|nr:hypothetical protein FLACOL_01494 [Flavobacterium columnare]
MYKYIIFLALMFNFCVAQNNNMYKLDYGLRYRAYNDDGHDMCETQCTVNVIYSDGNQQQIAVINDNYNFYHAQIFESPKKISGIRIIAHARRQNYACWRCSCEGAHGYFDQSFYSAECISNDQTYHNGSNATEIGGNISFKITPIHTLEAPVIKTDPILRETYLPTDDKIILSGKTGFDATLYNYQYKFSTESEAEYKNIDSNLYKLDKLTVSAIDLFGVNEYLNHEGKYIDFRLVSCFSGSYPTAKSNTVQLKIFRSSPHIVNSYITHSTCHYSTDGIIKVNLDRPLIENEKLGCEVIDQNGNQDKNIPIGNLKLDSTNSFEIKNLPEGTYNVRIIGSINGIATYSNGANHLKSFVIKKPDPVTFKLTKTDIWCHGGQDGVIKIEANGGNKLEKETEDTKDSCKGINGLSRYCFSLDNGLTWKGFDTEFSHTLMGLTKETYTIQVRDWKGCNALQPNGAILKLSETIQQPQEAVSLSYTSIKQPTFYGGTNGQLVVAIKGGTPFDDHSYAYVWKNSKGVLQTNITPYYDATAKVYYLTLTGIPSDTYTLTVRDKNYTSATNKDGCTVANSTQFLNQPAPIVVKLNVLRSISCNVTNVFGNEADLNPVDGQRDESQDGILQATVTGGVPFTGSDNNGLPYKYIWSKQKLDGSWEIWNDQDATAQYLNHGNYSLNVEDKNGIRLGIYVNNVISQETPVIQFMPQPSKLELQFQKSDISCSAGNNGWITAIPKGGTPPYTYEWTTGATTAQITNLIANNYFVKVVDAKGCFVQGSMLIDQPNGVVINGIVTSPTCHDGVDGSIITTVTGGTPPYTYSWSTGGNTKDIVSLTSGDYQLTVVDSKGCTYYKNFKLDNPDPIVVNLGGNRTLCNGQQLDLDISIPDPQAQYSWTSTQGFSSNSAKVSLTQAGTYTAKVISSKGCLGEDSFVLKTSNVAISSEFFLTSQAYLNDEVILINASNPLGENTSWEIPNTVTIVNQNEKYIVLKFRSLGSYTISLKQTQGDCYALYSKTINVEPKLINPTIGNEAQPFITEFLVTPNPSNGDFQTIVKLAESSPIKLRLYPINGQQPILEKSENGQKSYVLDFNSSLATGTYALILETAKETLVKKIIIY